MASIDDDTAGSVEIRAMTKEDLSAVMGIEIASFPDPWSPLAYLSEPDHNPRAHYLVAVGPSCGVIGYAGWWDAHEQGHATITKVAVSGLARRSGVGKRLVDAMVAGARGAGCESIQLEMRAGNAAARAFYGSLGFDEVAVHAGYYEFPPDDAAILARDVGAGHER